MIMNIKTKLANKSNYNNGRNSPIKYIVILFKKLVFKVYQELDLKVYSEIKNLISFHFEFYK